MNNDKPIISQQTIHNVTADHVDVSIHVYYGFASVDVTIGSVNTVLFTKDEKSARSIVAMLGLASTYNHTVERDEVLV